MNNKIITLERAKELYDDLFDKSVNLVQVTTKKLMLLKESSSLIPGTLYRITDYNGPSVLNSPYTNAKNQFDIIVAATSSNTLCEEARAIKSQNDSYFSTRKSNLEGWKLKVKISNYYILKNLSGYKFEIYKKDISKEELDAIYTEAGHPEWNEIYKYYFEDEMADVIFIFKNLPYKKNEKYLLGGWGIYEIDPTSPDCEPEWKYEDMEIISEISISYLKDEWGNEAPYDFKNVLKNGKYTFNMDSLDPDDQSCWGTFKRNVIKSNKGDYKDFKDFSSLIKKEDNIVGNISIVKNDDKSLGNLDVEGSLTVHGGQNINGDFSVVGSLQNGQEVITPGNYSHAEGYRTQANGQYSHADGIGTKTAALTEGQHVSGKYNKVVENAIEVVGCGTGDNEVDRANSRYVDGNGHTHFTKNVEVEDGNTFTVGTGKTSLKGTLAVTGATTLNDKLTINNNGLDVTGDTSLNSNLTVTGTTTLNNLLTINNNGLKITGTSSSEKASISSDGNAKFTGQISGGTLNVSGATSLNNTLTVTETSTLTGGVTGGLSIKDNGLDVNGTTTLNDKLTIKQKGLEVNGATILNNDLTVTGLSTLNGGLSLNGVNKVVPVYYGEWKDFKKLKLTTNTLGVIHDNSLRDDILIMKFPSSVIETYQIISEKVYIIIPDGESLSTLPTDLLKSLFEVETPAINGQFSFIISDGTGAKGIDFNSKRILKNVVYINTPTTNSYQRESAMPVVIMGEPIGADKPAYCLGDIFVTK